MYTFDIHQVQDSPRTLNVRLLRNGSILAIKDVINLWQEGKGFLYTFFESLEQVPYKAYRWETPGVIKAGTTGPFEYVVVEDPRLDLPADGGAFSNWFEACEQDDFVTAFPNLGGDAQMVVPLPRSRNISMYSHFASFHRGASTAQKEALWIAVGRAMALRLGERPVWLSSAGGGIPWLHVRLDSRPKYYSYQPYRNIS